MSRVDDYGVDWIDEEGALVRRLRNLEWPDRELAPEQRQRCWEDFKRRMGEQAEVRDESSPATGLSVAPTTMPADERHARRDLLGQIAKLETDLSALFCSAYPRVGFDWRVPSRGGPRMLSLHELEELRDDLAERVHDVGRELGERTYVEEQNRCLIEEMTLAPERHKFVRVSAEDIGERGCKHWHVQPRWGLLGMFLNWWRVRISSGCPLAT